MDDNIWAERSNNRNEGGGDERLISLPQAIT